MRLNWSPLLVLWTALCLVNVLCDETKAEAKKDGGSTEEEDPTLLKQAPTEEVKRRMAHLVEEYVDRDKDGFVSIEELRDWIKGIHEAMTLDNVEQQWSYYKPDVKESKETWDGYKPEEQWSLSWEKYKTMTYPEDGSATESPVAGMSQKDLLERAERRWKLADADKDNKLSKEEFHAFLHPDEFDRMKELLVTEATEDMDKDKNAEVSLEEYMDYMKKMAGAEKDDPQWAPAQQNQFTSYLDKNKDGSLNKEEMKEWILPPYDRSDAEAWRLMSVADTDQDNKLSKDDILNQYQFFLVLQPPEFWAVGAENKTHDEF